MSDWQPIETAPRDYTHILIWDSDRAMVARWGYSDLFDREPKEWIYGDCSGEYNDYQVIDSPTHWMPLPEPPA